MTTERLKDVVYEFVWNSTTEPTTLARVRRHLTQKRGPLVAHLSPRDLTIVVTRILYEGVRDGRIMRATGTCKEEQLYTGRVPVAYLPGRA